MEPGERPHEPNRPGKLRLWYGFAAAPTAWAMQGVIAVMVSAELCPNNLPNWSLMGENGVRLLLGLITLGLFAVAI